MRTLYRTQEDAKRALKESGRTGYLSMADNRSNLDIDYDSFGGEDICWSGEVQAYRTDDGDISGARRRERLVGPESPAQLAHVMRLMADWLFENHSELL